MLEDTGKRVKSENDSLARRFRSNRQSQEEKVEVVHVTEEDMHSLEETRDSMRRAAEERGLNQTGNHD